jgi:CPA1 family monovalent cation:H+ antiporter
MSFIEISIFLLFLATISVPIAARSHLPFEIFLVAASAIISFIPSLPKIEISPGIIFHLVLPPVIFSAAYFLSWQDFKFNFRPIGLLAFGLTIFTAISVAFITSRLIPGFTWKEGLLLGAIVSPTDATSAVAVIKKLGAKRRIITILEGESMINDATALVLFRFSLAAILLDSFSFTQAASQFVSITIGGIVIGLIIGVISIYWLQKLKDIQAETTLTFITAFSSFLISERLGFSGVIATVVCGIYCGIRFHDFSSSSTRINTKSNWRTLIFIINCFAFTLIGIELPLVVHNLGPYSIFDLVLYSFAVILVLFLARLIWIYAIAYFSRKLVPSIALKDPMPSWQMLFVLSWANMRGIISLAAVLAIPIHTINGTLFPHRNIFIFITYCVIVATLLIPTLTLPFLVKIFKLIEDPIAKVKEEALARIYAYEGVIEKLSGITKTEKIPDPVFNEFRDHFQQRLKIIKTQLNESPSSTLNEEYTAFRKLTLAAIISEREILLKLRKSGEIHNEVFHLLSDELDVEELRAKTLRL